MKITQIECVPLSLPSSRGRKNSILLVKVHTDEGITGIGDGGGVNQDIATAMIKSWAPFLIGANPLDRGVIMSRLSMFIRSVWGPSYPAVVATIDFALWDLVGKIMNQPVYQLLGGKAVDKLRFEYYVVPDSSPQGVEKALAL